MDVVSFYSFRPANYRFRQSHTGDSVCWQKELKGLFIRGKIRHVLHKTRFEIDLGAVYLDLLLDFIVNPSKIKSKSVQ